MGPRETYDTALRLRTFRRAAAVLCLAVLACLTTPAAAETPPRPTSITVVMDDNYPPYIFRTGDGSLHGILKDMWELWSLKTGIQVNLLAMDWARAQAVMGAGDADAIDTIFQTPDRQTIYDFSAPYATIDVPIYFHKSISGISNAETLRGFTVGVKDGDACIDWLEARDIRSLKRYPSYETMIESAGKQEIRIFCVDQPPASYFLLKSALEAEFRHTAPLYSGQFHRAVRKGNATTFHLIEDGFAKITAEEHRRIETRWMGSPLSQGEQRYMEAVTWALEAMAVGALLLGVWTWELRRKVRSRTRELVNTLDALRIGERHYRELVSLTPVAVFETDADGLCVFVNERWPAITGQPAEAVLGGDWTEIAISEDRPRIRDGWTGVIRDRGPFQAEFRTLGPDGQENWVLGQASPRDTDSGLVRGYIGTITDISASKAAEAALAASETRFRTIFDNINDAIFIHHIDTGAILAVNRRMAEMYGFADPAEVIGLSASRLSEGGPPYDEAAAQAWLAKALAGEPQLFEWRARAKDGRLFWVEISMRRAPISADQDVILVVVRDISERKQAERALTERTEALERSNADLEQFAYVASHDLREPLRMVSSYMSLLERRYGDRLEKDGHEFIAFAKEGAIRMDHLVQDLLEFSRVGRIANPPTLTSVDAILGNVQTALATVIADAGAEIRVPTPLPAVMCRDTEIFLLLQNLISNGLKFRDPSRPPVIRITAERQGAEWRFAIADNGIGLEPVYSERIFKIFHRLHTREKYEGTGIGLSICKKIVEHHGGRIWVKATPGEGATFFFTLTA
ncbi:MAG: PAS domain S-box protein [Phaeospirillum sp.]|nr:PAS domain S-box protein [Phaeospirillum sp.]